MSIHQPSNANILWFLPTHGDGRYLGTTTGGREVNFNYLRQIAQAADQLGYFGVLLPTGTKLRGFLGGGVCRRALDRTTALSGGGAARPAIAERRGADDRDAGPGVERPAAGQRRHRRRSRREQGRRHLPRS